MNLIFKINIAFILLLFISEKPSQTTTWMFEESNKKGFIKIIETNSIISSIFIQENNNVWEKVNIDKLVNSYKSYIRIKTSYAISELFIYWQEGKLIQVFTNGKEKIFNLIK